jgi:hypothetical protein
MKIKNAILLAAVFVAVIGASFLQAQQKGQLNVSVSTESMVADSNSQPAPDASIAGEADAADPVPVPVPTPPPQGGGPIARTSQDNEWHISVSPYLWFPGVHGTVGALGRDASFKASPTDLLSNFKFGLMGAVEARRNRLLIPIDMMWIRLEDDKALPFPPSLTAVSATIKATEFILTPKIGIRLINEKKVTADFLAGIRYWHFGENLQFSPSVLNLNFSKSQNWVDPVVGGRIQLALTPKIGFIAAGDAGGWGTGSQLEYQIVGLLGYKVKPTMTLQAGYRYLYVDYAKGGPAGAFATATTAGIVIGATVTLK